jgi:hypothetical protein
MPVKLNVTDKVKSILLNHPKTRDCDELLLVKIWISENDSIRDETFYYFATLFASGKLTSPESVRRTRAKLQQEFPELRGKLYEERHRRTEEIKSQLKEKEFYQNHDGQI